MEDVRKEPGEDWVEPSLTSAPSYEDHYGAPHGVLEHMQPLGEAPSAKVKSRVRSEGPRKSAHGRSSAAVGLDAQETPEGTPAPPAAAPVQVDGSIPPPAVKADDEKDDDYAPAVNKKAGATRPKTAPRHSDATGFAKKLRAEARKGGSSAKKRVYDPAKLQRVVESAKARAMEVGKPDLAAAVHEIWVESLKSVHLTDLLEAILTTTATAAQTEDFQNHVKRAKKRLRDAKEKHRKKPAKNNTNGTQALPLRSPSDSTSQPAPPPTTNFAVPSTEHTDSSKTRLSLKVKSPTKQPRRRPEQGGKMASLPPKSRARSGSETSELTDLTSDGEGPLPPGVADQLSHGPPSVAAKTNGIHGKDHAAERGSLAAPGGKLKRSSAEAELDDEGWEREKVIITKKAKLGETVTRDTPYQESDMRSSAREARQSRTTRTKPTSLYTAYHEDGAEGTWEEGEDEEFKKHLAGYGGLSVAGGAGRESPIGDDDNEELSENNDFCSACGGSGFLLCCDGCDRSFHFSCLDPPLNDEASELNEPWFCYICVAKRPIVSELPDKLPQRGLFAPLFSILKKQNPSNFALPLDIRDYFEGVQADGNGNFIEALHSRTRNRAGYDELPDHYKLKDSKGKTVLCYHCSKSSQGQPPRPIIQCDYCNESWHLDCLDPPMANPPARNWEGKKIHDWMCPLHADQELRKVDASLLVPRRKVHVRRPRNPKIVDAALARGFQNNGVIDVQDEESGDDSDAEFYEEESPDEPNEPVIHRMPARGIKLDFIDRIKSTRMQDLRNQRIRKRLRTRTAPPRIMQQANFARRSFAEKQLALNLAQFASANKDLELGSDQVDNLVGALIAEAPSEVVDEFMAAENAANQKAKASAPAVIPPSPPNSVPTDPISTSQRKQLQMLQELIRRKLETVESSEASMGDTEPSRCVPS
ncbi:hypothetical protein LTR48_004181 [Friedmanniomyces endolithicus]|uniref:PHD-type domain-containing protein n=1 Tax=Rachicladosporium monterosium TaxID=1507873 RepID=A0ABR0L604_9PEZI|nr:hypothetical protein LTR48_004181 [Friedmanniomyces endolithicus]KAK5144049.1 hypothetical protein LTR32_003951 [Rachicladosporium monterosium]